METFLNIAVEALRLIPLILVFYIPALIGLVILKERSEDYKVKVGVIFAVAFGSVTAVKLIFRTVSALQVAWTLGLTLLQIAVALILAAVTVYKLAD